MSDRRDQIVRHLRNRYGPEHSWPPVRAFVLTLGVGFVVTVTVIAVTAPSAPAALLGVATGVLGGLITGAVFVIWEMRMEAFVSQEQAALLNGEEE